MLLLSKGPGSARSRNVKGEVPVISKSLPVSVCDVNVRRLDLVSSEMGKREKMGACIAAVHIMHAESDQERLVFASECLPRKAKTTFADVQSLCKVCRPKALQATFPGLSLRIS
jgi:hypothetical protein